MLPDLACYKRYSRAHIHGHGCLFLSHNLATQVVVNATAMMLLFQPKCVNCEGDHRNGGCEETVTEQKEPEAERNREHMNMYMDKKTFLAFIAMVVNCAVDIPRKSERTKIVLVAASRFLNVEDISAEELDNCLREGFASTQPAMAEKKKRSISKGIMWVVIIK